jgi:hypothetical protein
LPTWCVLTAFITTSLNLALCSPSLLNSSNQRKAFIVCIAPAKLTCLGLIFSCRAAAAMVCLTRLYASRCIQISFRTISGVWHVKMSILSVC